MELNGLILTRDNLLVQTLERSDLSPQGIKIPEAHQLKAHQGIVRVIGPGAWTDTGVRMAPDFAPGDLVFFNEFAGHKIDPEYPTWLVVANSIDVFAGRRAAALVEKLQVVEHADGRIHLAKDGCEECHAPVAAAARLRLEEERQHLRDKEAAELLAMPPGPRLITP
jgi:co-chaperonin GroES (HSP10)